MKKLLLLGVLIILFLPAVALMVWAQSVSETSFQLTVVKKTIGGDGSFDFEIEKQGELNSAYIENLFSVFASGDISDESDQFSISTQDGQGEYSYDYKVNAFFRNQTFGVSKPWVGIKIH